MHPRGMRVLVNIFLILGVVNFLMVAAAPPIIGAIVFNDMCDYECPRHYSPVCAVDSSGVSRTFGNRCIAELMYCFERRYYAIVKQGEC